MDSVSCVREGRQLPSAPVVFREWENSLYSENLSY